MIKPIITEDVVTLKSLRKAAGITQRSLANLCKVKHNTVSGWENGTRRPSRELALRLAEVFGQDFEDIDKMFLNKTGWK